MRNQLHCTVCDTPLRGELDTYGDIGGEMCWDCWSTDQGYDDVWYGVAPHHHDFSRTGSWIGSTVHDPLPDKNLWGWYWIENMEAWFKPDVEDTGCGLWSRVKPDSPDYWAMGEPDEGN